MPIVDNSYAQAVAPLLIIYRVLKGRALTSKTIRELKERETIRTAGGSVLEVARHSTDSPHADSTSDDRKGESEAMV